MSISSVNPFLSSLYTQYCNGTSTTANKTAQYPSSSNSQGISNINGDTFEFSPPTMQTGYTNSAAGTNGTQMAPPPPPPASEDSSDSTNDDTITSFLDKVVNGTVTDTDLEEMQTYLQNLSTESTESTTTGTQMAPPPPPPPPPASEDSSDSTGDDTIKSFLDKVANGTVTDTDLQNMQIYFQQ